MKGVRNIYCIFYTAWVIFPGLHLHQKQTLEEIEQTARMEKLTQEGMSNDKSTRSVDIIE